MFSQVDTGHKISRCFASWNVVILYTFLLKTWQVKREILTFTVWIWNNKDIKVTSKKAEEKIKKLWVLPRSWLSHEMVMKSFRSKTFFCFSFSHACKLGKWEIFTSKSDKTEIFVSSSWDWLSESFQLYDNHNDFKVLQVVCQCSGCFRLSQYLSSRITLFC